MFWFSGKCIFCISENICTHCNTGLLVEELDKSRHCLKDNNNKQYYFIYDDKGIIYYPLKEEFPIIKFVNQKIILFLLMQGFLIIILIVLLRKKLMNFEMNMLK